MVCGFGGLIFREIFKTKPGPFPAPKKQNLQTETPGSIEKNAPRRESSHIRSKAHDGSTPPGEHGSSASGRPLYIALNKTQRGLFGSDSGYYPKLGAALYQRDVHSDTDMLPAFGTFLADPDITIAAYSATHPAFREATPRKCSKCFLRTSKQSRKNEQIVEAVPYFQPPQSNS